MREFPDNFLSIKNGILGCRACNLPDISLKKSSIKSHLEGETHKRNLTRKDRSQLTLLDYKRIIVGNEIDETAAGNTLPLDVNAYRMTVAHALLKSGTPFAILDAGNEMRQLLEDGHSSCPKQACSDLIPSLNKKEHLLTLEELHGASSFSISTDGTINVAEVLAMVRNTFKISMLTTHLFYLLHRSIILPMSLSFQVVRFVCEKKTIQQRSLCLKFLADPLTGNALAAQIIDVVMTQSGQHPQKLRFNTADGCATNGLANDVMKAIFPQCCDLICLSHTSNLPMKLPTSNKFLQT